MSRDEIVERFRLEDVSPSPGTFDYAKLDWLNGVYLRALEPREYADRLVLWVGEHGLRLAGRARPRRRAARPGEDRAARGVPRVRRVPLRRRRARPRRARRADARRGGGGPRRRRAVVGRGDRGAAEGALRGARREAADGLRADPRGGHGLARLARALRVARAARPRGDARAPAARRRGRRSVTPRTVTEYEARLDAFGIERAEEARAVRVGEKETSEQAAIVARYADLFTQEQLDALRAAEAAADDAQREAVARLRLTCQDGIVTRELAEDEDALENALLGARVPWDGDELPLRSAQARLAVEPDYARRSALGEAVLAVSTTFDDERRSLLTARNALEGDVSGIADPVARSEDEKGGVLLRPILDAVDTARVESTPAFTPAREHWFDRLLGPERDDVPPSAHAAWIRRLSPLEATYTKEASVPVCVATLARLGFDLAAEPGIRTDLDDRPQKSPRACVIPSDPPRLVHLITRAQGGLHDYEAFLHEAGHALHYAGCDPALPLAFRRLSRDHALTEIYSFLLDSISGEAGWHAEHFGLTDGEAEENARAARFSNTLLFRRYSAKLGFELDFWSRFPTAGPTPDGYEERLTAATGVRYPAANHLADMDAGFYSADYLRAWIRAAQVRAYLRREVGHDWWRNAETGALLRDLFREGTRPTTEEVAARIGFDPLDTAPLVADLGG